MSRRKKVTVSPIVPIRAELKSTIIIDSDGHEVDGAEAFDGFLDHLTEIAVGGAEAQEYRVMLYLKRLTYQGDDPKWVICSDMGDEVLSKAGNWVREGIPSSRTDKHKKRTQFDSIEEAWPLAVVAQAQRTRTARVWHENMRIRQEADAVLEIESKIESSEYEDIAVNA